MGFLAASAGALAVGMLSHLLYGLPLPQHVHCNGDPGDEVRPGYTPGRASCKGAWLVVQASDKIQGLIWAHKYLQGPGC